MIIINRTLKKIHVFVIDMYKGLSNLKDHTLKDMSGPSTYMVPESVIMVCGRRFLYPRNRHDPFLRNEKKDFYHFSEKVVMHLYYPCKRYKRIWYYTSRNFPQAMNTYMGWIHEELRQTAHDTGSTHSCKETLDAIMSTRIATTGPLKR